MDKRFWSGAVAVVTVVIAGAGVLPSLLLRPAVDDDPMAGSVEPAPFMSKPAKLVDYEPPRPVAAGMSTPLPQAVVQPVDVKSAATVPAPAAPAGVSAVKPATAVQIAASHAVPPDMQAEKTVSDASGAATAAAVALTTSVVAASAAPAAEPTGAAFPPVQPVGLAPQAAPHASPMWNAAAPAVVAARPVRERVVRQAASRERAKPRRNGRPAPFPIRQFLAALRR